MSGGIFAPIVVPIKNLLLLIFAVIPGHDLGIAIVILTVIIRLLLWPLLKKQLSHQRKLRELQPEIAAIKKKTKGDKTKESQLMVELFKEREVNPFSSIGLALLQFPILIALFAVLRDIFNPEVLSQGVYGFVREMDAVKALINNPEAAQYSILGVNLAQRSIVLAVIAGIGQFLQTKQLTPADTTQSSPAQRLGLNATLIFPIVTVAIASRFPSALALYWVASSLVALIQQTILLREDLQFMQRISARIGVKKPKSRTAKK